MASRKLPLWARALKRIDRLAWHAYRAHEVARTEIFRAWLAPELRDLVIEDAYAKQSAYLPGGTTFERGLFDWEAKVLASDLFPKRGRLLLGAAGGGRELRVLLERGFDVVAFEPNPVLCAGARKVASARGARKVIDASYGDLVRAAETRTGPLADPCARPFDATILGWGSLIHVIEPAEQRALLASVRVISPDAPVLMSFFLRPLGDARGKGDRLGEILRKTFVRMGGRDAPAGLAYEMNGGFVYCFSEEEIHALAFDTGYEVALLTDAPFPHAVLRPLAKP